MKTSSIGVKYLVCERAMSSGKLSHSVAIILKALSLGYQFGFEIMEVTGLPSGTVYPALRRLERDGMVSSNWEAEDEALKEQRPARRYYELTKMGKEAESTAVKRYPLLSRLLPEKLVKTL
jgi:DNA-binding transcriptional ArsR family regulator